MLVILARKFHDFMRVHVVTCCMKWRVNCTLRKVKEDTALTALSHYHRICDTSIMDRFAAHTLYSIQVLQSEVFLVPFHS